MYVYILYSRSLKKYYVGQTADFVARLNKHNKGGSRFTKRGAPWEQIWLKEVKNRSEAILLERKIKARGARRYLVDMDFEFKID